MRGGGGQEDEDVLGPLVRAERAEHRGGGVHVIREAGFDLGRSYAQLMSHARTNQDD